MGANSERDSQRGRVIARLVLRHSRPVQRFGRSVRFGSGLRNVAELLLRLGELLLREQRVRESDLQLREKVVGGQKAFNAMALRAAGVHDDDRRRPLRTEALERIALFLDVKSGWNEVLRDEFADLGIRINLGFQPSASPSHRCSGEIEQQRFVLLFGLCERFVGVADPLNLGHIASWVQGGARRALLREHQLA